MDTPWKPLGLPRWYCHLLTTCLVMGLCVLSGCSAADDFVAGTYEVDAAEVRNIVVDVTDRSITVSPSSDGQVHIDYFHSPKEFYNISLEDGTLTMKYDEDKNWTDFISVKPADSVRQIDIRVPENTISSLTADTKNEGISVSNLELDDIDLYSNGGDINVADIEDATDGRYIIQRASIADAAPGGDVIKLLVTIGLPDTDDVVDYMVSVDRYGKLSPMVVHTYY